MAGPRVIQIASVAELRAQAAAWDDLWRRSDATTPALRAELIAQWLEHFAPRAAFRALVVEEGGQWLAALPLFGRSVAWIFSAGATVGNPWSSHADVLCDSARTCDASLGDALVHAAVGLPWQLLWLVGAVFDAPRWRALEEAFARAGMAAVRRQRWMSGRVAVDRDWSTCQQRWSSDHRRHMARCFQHLATRGPVSLQFCDRLPCGEVEMRLRQALEVEDAGWKGAAGTSILHTPGMFAFFLRQALQLAEWKQLVLATLQCGPTPVAFSYGMAAKGVFHSYKVGYDRRFADCSPGQLLRYCLLERFHAEADYAALDFVGPLNEAQSHWRPELHPVGRLMVAPRPDLGRIALRSYAWLAGLPENPRR